MQIKPGHASGAPTEWSGAKGVIEKWLARLCATESMMELISAVVMFLAGLIALALTLCIPTALFYIILLRTDSLVHGLGVKDSRTGPILFAVLFLLFMSVSIFHACKTRWRTESAIHINFGTSFASMTNLILEIMSVGPIFMVLAVQDFQKYRRLTRVDIAQVGALILWLYDKGARAGFAEIALALPGLNVVRVLPQLRDLPGVYWWPDEGSISLSESLCDNLARLLRRDPANSFNSAKARPKPPYFGQPAPGFSAEMLSWYAILDLPPFATLQQVKTRYRKLAKIHHPDARARNRPAGETADDEQMKRINEAYHSILENSQNQAHSFN